MAKSKSAHELLTEFLDKHDMSLAEFGRQVDCSKSFAGKLKLGEETPGLALAARIKRLTGIDCERWVPDA